MIVTLGKCIYTCSSKPMIEILGCFTKISAKYQISEVVEASKNVILLKNGYSIKKINEVLIFYKLKLI